MNDLKKALTHAIVNSLTHCVLTLSIAIVLMMQPAAIADDWPQWGGPKRDLVWRESGHHDRDSTISEK